jgi:hypothetical protein
MHLITSCSHIKLTTIWLHQVLKHFFKTFLKTLLHVSDRYSARQTHTPQVNLCRQTSATCTYTANFSHEHLYELPEDGPMNGPKHVGVFLKKF